MKMTRYARAALWAAMLSASPAMADSLRLEVESGAITGITGKQDGRLSVSISGQSSRDLHEFTESHVGQSIDVLVDGKLMVSSIIREPIRGRQLPIMLSMTDAEWRETIARLIAGTAALELRTSGP